jgi:hypothetical protein
MKMENETSLPGMGGGGLKENDGRGEFNYDTHCKNFCKCHSVPLVQQKYENKKGK